MLKPTILALIGALPTIGSVARIELRR